MTTSGQSSSLTGSKQQPAESLMVGMYPSYLSLLKGKCLTCMSFIFPCQFHTLLDI